MNPCKFYKCLSDDTRLKSLLLISQVGDACVCDLMSALGLDQPKMSRHLAELRKCGIVLDERRGKWMYYTLHPDLPKWAHQVILTTAESNKAYFSEALGNLRISPPASACEYTALDLWRGVPLNSYSIDKRLNVKVGRLDHALLI